MEYLLKKSKENIHIEYDDGDFSNNLFGSNFTLIPNSANKSLELRIDLSSNFRVRNKQTNTYYDMMELERNIDRLKVLSFNDKTVIKLLKQIWNNLNFKVENLILSVFLRQAHSFDVSLEKDGVGNLVFTIMK